MATYLTKPMKSSRVLQFARRPLALAVSLCFSAASWALPADPTVVAGSAAFQQNGAALTVTTTTHNAIIDWQKFNIGAGETTRFIQPAASSAVMNRVVAAEPSLIYGNLSSNGQVFLINPAGIMVGPSGRIDTQGFVASTLGISNQDFLAGRMLFKNDEFNTLGAGVINQGRIVTPHGGSVYLIGGDVDNRGIIATPHGETILAAGHTVSLIDSATPGVKVEITGATGTATNLGEIVSTAGRIGIAGVIVKNSGSLNAASVVERGGRIFLQAKQESRVDGQARIDAGGAQGGDISVLGKQVVVTDQAAIDASGADGGGTIRIGGDYRGANPEVQNADTTFLGAETRLTADATKVGAGGTVVVWADDSTQALGHISARGGAAGGDGGLIETSGKRMLEVARAADASAPYGRGGTWLLDPNNVTIQATGSDTGVTGNPNFVSTADSAIITTATLQTALNNGTNVSIATSSGGAQAGDITLNSPLLKTAGGNATLTLSAHNNINLNQTITSGSGLLNLTLIPNSDASGGGTATVAASLTGIGAFTVGGAGSVTFSGGTSSFATSYSAASTSITGGNIAIPATPLTLASLQMSAGSLTSGALITLTGSGNWSGGALAGGGTLKIDSGATLNIEGAGAKHLNGFNFDNTGTVVWKGSGSIDLELNSSISRFDNRGVFDIQGNGSWGNVSGSQFGSFTLNNLSGGLVKRTVNTGAAQFAAGAEFFNQAGATLDIQTGSLNLSGGGFQAGTVALATSTLLEIGNNFSLKNASNISGTGVLLLNGGELELQGASSVSNFEQYGGILGGNGALTLTGNGNWNGGAWQGGGTFKIASGATLNIDGAATRYLNGYNFDNAGIVIWKNGGAVDIELDNSSSTFVNRGIFEIQSNNSWGNVLCCQSGSFTLINQSGATIRRTASAATDTATFTLGTKLENQPGASIDLQNGVLQLNGELLQSGAIKTAATATLRKLDGFANQSGGTISGHGTVDVGANALTNHGIIAPGDASPPQATSLDSGMSTAMAVVASPRIGTLTVKGNLLQGTGGRINLDIAGPGSNDLIAVTGQATLDGTLAIDQLGYTPTEGETFNGISATGVAGKFTTVVSPLRSYYEAGYDSGLVRMTYLMAQGTNFWLLDSDGLWDNAANWSLGVPLSGQKVVIDRPSGSYTVTLPSGNSYTIASLNSQENLTLQGNLTVNGDGMSGATVAILGGALTAKSNLSLAKLTLNSGSLSVLGDLAITDSFSYSGGAIGGTAANIAIAQTSGVLAVPTMTASNTIKLLAKAGRVELLGNLTTTADTGYIVIGGAQGLLNKAGANALTVGSKGRWLVVAPDPASVTKNGLSSNFRHYNAQLSDFKPESVVEKGNGFIYAAPAGTLTVTPVLSRQSQIYGDVATLEVGYTLSGFADNEDAASNIGLSGLTAFTLPPLLLKQANVGNYSIAYTGGLTSARGYTFAPAPSQTYSIAPRPLSLSVSGSKVYDRSTALDNAIFSLSNIANADNLSATGSVVFADNANAGSTKPLIASRLALSGAAAANYSLAETATGVGSILPRPIGVGGLGVDNKVYDGTTVATANGQAIFGNLIAGDKVALGAVAARFGDANVGSQKTVSFGDLTLTGADAGNYILETRALTASADIVPRPLGLALSGSKVYDGTTALDAPVYVLSNVVAGDALSVSGAASFTDNANAGSNKPLIAGKPMLSGAAAANYTLANTVAGLGEISPRPLSLTLEGSKVYDRSTALDTPLFTLTNRIDGDALEVAAKVVFSDNANVGSNKPLTAQDIVLKGSAAANYSVAATATGTGKIEPKAVNLTVSGSKTFDATTVLPAPTFALEGVLSDDAVTVGGSVGFKDAFVGINKAIAGETILSGAAAANYVIGSTGSKAEIKADPANFVWAKASGAWETGDNWNQGVVPVDGASVTLPTLDAAISFNQGSATLKTLTSLSSLIVNGGSFRLGETGANRSSFGAATQLTVAGGTLIVDGRLDAPRLSLNSGAIAGTGILNVGQEFLNNAANNFAATFRELYLNRSGDFAANESYTASQELHLNSSSGGIQSPLKAPKLELSAKNTIDIRSQATFVAASSSDGNIAIDNTGALTTLGIEAELGSVAITARSPLTIAGAGINAGGAIRLAAAASSAGGDNLTINAKVATTRRVDPAAGISLAAGDDLIVKEKLESNGGPIAKTAGGNVDDPINQISLPVEQATIDNNVVASQRAIDRAADPEKSESKPPAPPPPAVDSGKLGGNLASTPQKMTVGGDESSFGAKEPSLPPPPSAVPEAKAEDKPAPSSAAKEPKPADKPADKPAAKAKEQKSDDKPADKSDDKSTDKSDDEGKKEKKERADSKEEKKEENKPAAKKLAQCS